VHALHGWRRELFGEQALALKAGRLSLGIANGEVTTFAASSESEADASQSHEAGG